MLNERGFKMKTIVYEKRNVYGNENKYVMNPEDAKLVSQLTGKKTIDSKDVESLKGLGFEVFEIKEYLRSCQHDVTLN